MICKIPTSENLFFPNLLINNDFQINQRRNSSYSGAVYTVDMWKLHTEVGKLVVNDGYVTLTGSSLIQYIPKNIFETKSYTQVVKLKDENAKVFHYDNFDGTYKELTVDGLKCALEYSTRNKALVFYIWNKDTDINIEYADLFEGSIAYKHIKQSYYDALWDCFKYLQVLGTLNIPLSKIWGEVRNSTLLGYVGIYRKMYGTPIINNDFSNLYSDANESGHDFNKADVLINCTVSDANLRIRITKKTLTDFFNRDYEYFINTNGYTIISCEPL